MQYRVIEFFTDLQDGEHAYNPGDEFPRKGVEVSAERIAELSGTHNKQGKALIVQAKAVEEEDKAAEKPRFKKKSKE